MGHIAGSHNRFTAKAVQKLPVIGPSPVISPDKLRAVPGNHRLGIKIYRFCQRNELPQAFSDQAVRIGIGFVLGQPSR